MRVKIQRWNCESKSTGKENMRYNDRIFYSGRNHHYTP